MRFVLRGTITGHTNVRLIHVPLGNNDKMPDDLV